MSFQIADVPALPPGVESPADLKGTWVIARVRGQFERKLVYLLHTVAPGIGWALPMQTVQRRSGGQNRGTYTRLIFPSYLFVCCRHEDDYYELVAREGVFERINVKNQAEFAREITAFHMAANEGMLRDDHADLIPGRKCEIVRGALKGCVGWIDARDGKGNVVLKVTILGAARPTTVPIEDVELI